MLARAALALDSDGSNPAGKPVIAGETELRAHVIAEIKAHLGIPPFDERPESVEKICDALDDFADELVGYPDLNGALVRLAERGELASDRFSINVVEPIREFHGSHFATEQLRIEETV